MGSTGMTSIGVEDSGRDDVEWSLRFGRVVSSAVRRNVEISKGMMLRIRTADAGNDCDCAINSGDGMTSSEGVQGEDSAPIAGERLL